MIDFESNPEKIFEELENLKHDNKRLMDSLNSAEETVDILSSLLSMALDVIETEANTADNFKLIIRISKELNG